MEDGGRALARYSARTHPATFFRPTYAATGQYMPRGGMLGFLGDAAAIPKKWSKGKVEPLKDLEMLFTAGAGVSGTSAAGASGMHIIRDTVGFIENLEGPD